MKYLARLVLSFVAAVTFLTHHPQYRTIELVFPAQEHVWHCAPENNPEMPDGIEIICDGNAK